MMMTTVFKQIIDGDIPVEFVHEDEECVAFHDQNPQAPTHIEINSNNELKEINKVGRANNRYKNKSNT